MRRNVGEKGVKGLVGYFMGYYTIWLALVKSFFVPFWEFEKRKAGLRSSDQHGKFKTRSLRTPKAAAPGCLIDQSC
jgi:hypothetical protein